MGQKGSTEAGSRSHLGSRRRSRTASASGERGTASESLRSMKDGEYSQIESMFKDLAKRSPTNTMDKATFLKVKPDKT